MARLLHTSAGALLASTVLARTRAGHCHAGMKNVRRRLLCLLAGAFCIDSAGVHEEPAADMQAWKMK
jgi:hypothetical protein